MDRDTALSKIKKCLAMARSTNANEAATAMRQAQKLMQQFGIDDAAIELADVAEATTPVRSMALPQWEVSLAKAVAEAFGCDVIVMRGHRLAFEQQYRRSAFRFIGVGAAAQVAAYAQEVLGRQCAKARLTHIAAQPKNCKQITKTARGDAFATAWVYSVIQMLDRFANGERNVELLEAYKAAKHPELSTLTPARRDVGRNVKDDSFRSGLAAGRQADLKRGVAGRPDQELLA